jgi:hypothetical protein
MAVDIIDNYVKKLEAHVHDLHVSVEEMGREKRERKARIVVLEYALEALGIVAEGYKKTQLELEGRIKAIVTAADVWALQTELRKEE